MKRTSELKRLSSYLIKDNPYLDLRNWKTCAIGYLRFATRTELQFEFDSEDIRPYYNEYEGIRAIMEYFDMCLGEFYWLFHHASYGDNLSGKIVGERILDWIKEKEL